MSASSLRLHISTVNHQLSARLSRISTRHLQELATDSNSLPAPMDDGDILAVTNLEDLPKCWKTDTDGHSDGLRTGLSVETQQIPVTVCVSAIPRIIVCIVSSHHSNQIYALSQLLSYFRLRLLHPPGPPRPIISFPKHNSRPENISGVDSSSDMSSSQSLNWCQRMEYLSSMKPKQSTSHA
ncbi:hypothetical protein EX30DRAFT_231842 [Ascodesmis nigricans]|uniref:Uncharacterized protein n=1 Tax=Ascodesmis nigricans TaxID=341454 RepID=A0A4S2MIE2_9PEZI|nr:hypothetical protein EX30DRAFT_231842 [Ascodesmis nigricans]